MAVRRLQARRGSKKMATIGELIINLRASTAAFSKDLEKAKSLSFDSAREIQRSLSRIGTVVATELAAAATAVTALTAKSIDYAEKISLASQKTGLSTEQFSALAYAARQVNLDTDTLSRSLVIMSKNLEKSNQQTLEGKAAHSALGTLFRGNVPIFLSTNDAFARSRNGWQPCRTDQKPPSPRRSSAKPAPRSFL